MVGKSLPEHLNKTPEPKDRLRAITATGNNTVIKALKKEGQKIVDTLEHVKIQIPILLFVCLSLLILILAIRFKPDIFWSLDSFCGSHPIYLERGSKVRNGAQ